MNLPNGISIILCAYNSSELLPETLKHLAGLQLPDGCSVELLLVNNASTDHTSEVASSEWKKHGSPYTLHLHHEKRPGLIFARKKGLKESRYAYILFVDDDNWLDENYLIEMLAIFEKHPKAAALGGMNQAVFESEKPAWFDAFEDSYAVGKPAKSFGEPDEIGLFGAGLCLRRAAYDELIHKGFESRLVGRTGESLSSGEDYELCKALKIAGWDIIFSPALKLQHFLTKPRLNWEYLKKLNQGISRSIIWFLAYEYWIAKCTHRAGFITDIKYSWFFLLLKKTLKTAWLKTQLMLRPKLRGEGSHILFEYERSKVVASDLIKNQRNFLALKNSIGKAGWKLKPKS